MGEQQPPNEMDVWVLAGQSNMEGIGELSAALPPNENIWSFTTAGRWEIAEDPLHRFWESFTPIHQNLIRPHMPEDRKHLSDAELAKLTAAERKHGAGLGLSFAQSMLAHTGRPIGLIPAAHGGSNIAQWDPDLKSKRGESLYGALFERLARCGRTPCGMLWYQGESEGWNPDAGKVYGRAFVNWIARLRADLNQPEFPILFVQISRTTLEVVHAGSWSAVQRAQYAIPDEVPFTAVTSAIDLPLVDVIHINAAGLKRLGARLAKMAIAMSAGTPGFQIGPRLQRAIYLPEPPDRSLVDLEFTGVSGALHPADHISGFQVLNANGEPHATCQVINAFRDPADPTSIRVRLSSPLSASDHLAYGHGLRPYCNAVDEADFPLCAMTISPARG